jgi:predicted ArsR family transcriptional regulator
MLQRRPCTAQDIGKAFNMHPNEVSKHLGKLLEDKRIRAQVANHQLYYLAGGGEASDLYNHEQAHEEKAITPARPSSDQWGGA